MKDDHIGDDIKNSYNAGFSDGLKRVEWIISENISELNSNGGEYENSEMVHILSYVLKQIKIQI